MGYTLADVTPDSLHCGGVNPAPVRPGGTTYFTVVYYSSGDNAPDYMDLVLAGPQTGTYAMSVKTDAAAVYRDGVYSNGEQYEAAVLLDTPGVYSFHFESAESGTPLRSPASGDMYGPSVITDDYAEWEATNYGTKENNSTHTDTFYSDNVYEIITEVQSSESNQRRRLSRLEHKWRIDVEGGVKVTFFLEAHRSAVYDDNYFLFEYSLDDSVYTAMVQVTSDTDTDYHQKYDLPTSTSGDVYIRVTDDDRKQGNYQMDQISIDSMFIRSLTQLSTDG